MTQANDSAVALAKLAIAYEKAHSVYYPAAAHQMAEPASFYLLSLDIEYWISPAGDSITCVRCRSTSRNVHDIENLYCGHCHAFFKFRSPEVSRLADL